MKNQKDTEVVWKHIKVFVLHISNFHENLFKFLIKQYIDTHTCINPSHFIAYTRRINHTSNKLLNYTNFLNFFTTPYISFVPCLRPMFLCFIYCNHKMTELLYWSLHKKQLKAIQNSKHHIQIPSNCYLCIILLSPYYFPK